MASSINKTLFNAAALTATSTSEKQQIQAGDIDFIGVLVATDTHADTTVDAKIQHSHDGVTWFDLITFTQLTDNGSEVKQLSTATLPKPAVLQFVRGVATLAGATQESTVTLHLYFDRQF